MQGGAMNKKTFPSFLAFSLILGALSSLGATSVYLKFDSAKSDPIIYNKDCSFYFVIAYSNKSYFRLNAKMSKGEEEIWSSYTSFSGLQGEGVTREFSFTIPKAKMSQGEHHFYFELLDVYGAMFANWSFYTSPGKSFTSELVKQDKTLMSSYPIAIHGQGLLHLVYKFNNVNPDRETTIRKVGINEISIEISHQGATPPSLVNGDTQVELRCLNYLSDFGAAEECVGYRSYPLSLYRYAQDETSYIYKLRLAGSFYYSMIDLSMSHTRRNVYDMPADDIYLPTGRGKNTGKFYFQFLFANLGPAKDTFLTQRHITFPKNHYGMKGNSDWSITWGIK